MVERGDPFYFLYNGFKKSSARRSYKINFGSSLLRSDEEKRRKKQRQRGRPKSKKKHGFGQMKTISGKKKKKKRKILKRDKSPLKGGVERPVM